ncbi:type IV pilus biogenesis/stability protein PilW [Aromatoleum sp.]|uniref:type IV pilus biogenesis/stability protein PilW n=1 Tax=Aromatoleum sp. TaxID=2307007 RepID=UPI002FC90EB1
MKQRAVVAAFVCASSLLGACATGAGAGGAVAERPVSQIPPANAAVASAKVHVDLGLAYLQIGRYAVALDEAKAALASDAAYSPAYHLMGLVYMYIDDHAAARESFQRALAMAPNDPEFNNSYGWFQCMTGQEKEGLQRLALAARNPYYQTPARPYTNAGLCHLRRGDDVAAEAEFRRAAQLEPANAQAIYHLAAIAYRRGGYVVARDYLIQLHQRTEPTAESVWLGARTERKLGNHEAESSYVAQLRGRFADSAEFRAMNQGNYE